MTCIILEMFDVSIVMCVMVRMYTYYYECLVGSYCEHAAPTFI